MWKKTKGSMAELVDAPDSKSGHFGGVGSIPSTPTIIFEKYFNLFFEFVQRVFFLGMLRINHNHTTEVTGF